MVNLSLVNTTENSVTLGVGHVLTSGNAKVNFTWYDYSLFSSMLLFSVLIGIYFGFIKKQATANDYLLGGRTMRPVPIAMSLVAR